jgi:transcriptional antiterminator RfaH
LREGNIELLSPPMNSAPPFTEQDYAWFCVRSQQKQERLACAALRRTLGVEVFAPRLRFRRPTRQGVVWAVEPLFPSYIFARFTRLQIPEVRSAMGVSGIVRFGDRPATLGDGVIAELQARVGTEELLTLPAAPSVGDEIRVCRGPFAGLEAVVTQVLPAKERVRILLEFLGQPTQVEIDLQSVAVPRVHPLTAR